MTRHFLSLSDISPGELELLLDLGLSLKADRREGMDVPLAGKTLLLLFNKPSTRTRVSFQVGMYQLGGVALDLRFQEIQIKRGETIKDTAMVLSRYADGLVIRTFAQDELEEWGRYSSVPIINGLTDLYHPCQVLSDLLTIREFKGGLDGLKLAYLGDGNNVLHSWIMATTLAAIELVMAVPEGFEPDPEIMARAEKSGFRGNKPRLTRDPREAVKDADIIYTDVWTSMGQEEEYQKRKAAFGAFQVNSSLVEAASSEVVVMHCLPAHRGDEITTEVLDGKHSVVTEQAENRLHMQKALLLFLLAPEGLIEGAS
jgi:ornithine carbamoyltransferase